MRPEHSRRLTVSLSLAMALSLVTVLPIAAATPSSLFTETFTSNPPDGSGSITGSCSSSGSGSFTFSTSGVATGPYPGSFTESGSFTIANSALTAFSATFTITSSAGAVTGSKSFDEEVQAVCIGTDLQLGADPGAGIPVTYTATINGAYRDTGMAILEKMNVSSGQFNFFQQFFETSNGVVALVPTSINQCLNNGWLNYPQFTNQGQCVSFVETHK